MLVSVRVSTKGACLQRRLGVDFAFVSTRGPTPQPSQPPTWRTHGATEPRNRREQGSFDHCWMEACHPARCVSLAAADPPKQPPALEHPRILTGRPPPVCQRSAQRRHRDRATKATYAIQPSSLDLCNIELQFLKSRIRLCRGWLPRSVALNPSFADRYSSLKAVVITRIQRTD